MKEILFKGYHKFGDTGEWVYGYYFRHPETDTHSIFLLNGGGSRVVDKNSVCQYTNINDINGEKIFSKDILEPTCGLPLTKDPGDIISLLPGNRYKVVWREGSYYLTKAKRKRNIPLRSVIVRGSGLKVVGNSYEL